MIVKMNLSDSITIHGRRVNKEAFIHLLQVACTDRKMTDEEYAVLHKEGRRFGFTDPEIDILMKVERNHEYIPPYSLEEKFGHLYQVAQMVLADDVINECERKMLRKFAIEAGFSYDKIDDLINLLIEGVKNNEDEEQLFVKFKKKLF